MATFILVHGAWHGGWCWERIVPLIEAAGHVALAPDLPGMGDDATPFADDVLAQWAEAVAALARGASEPVILVGHSRGGIVISEAAERAPEAVRLLVYVTAFLLPAGESLFANVAARPPGTGPVMAIDGAAGMCTVEASDRHGRFYHLCSDADAATAAGRLCREPLEPLGRGLRISDANFGRIPRAYIEATHDQAITLEHQRAMQRLFPCDRVITLESDHSPFYSARDALAEALVGLANR